MSFEVAIACDSDADACCLAGSLITASTMVPRDHEVELILSGGVAIRVGREIESLIHLRDSQSEAEAALQRALDAVHNLHASSARNLRRAGLMLFCGSVLAFFGLALWVAA